MQILQEDISTYQNYVRFEAKVASNLLAGKIPNCISSKVNLNEKVCVVSL